MTNPPKHIVFFAETVTLAHIARCISLANALIERGYRVTLAADSRYNDLLGELHFPHIALHSVSTEQFSYRLAQGLPAYSSKVLVDYVNEDLQIINQIKPDFIIGDFRLSLGISSRLAGVPCATITNAYWSPYALIDYPIPELPLLKITGVALAQKLFNLLRPLVFKIHSLAFNRVCVKFGLPSLAYDMREIYTHADFTLYADIESLFAMAPLPKNHIFIGPILWSASVPLPEWWGTLPSDKPVVFVTLGSSGDSRLLPTVIEALAQMPVTVICVTGKTSMIKSASPNLFIAEYLPADLVVKKSDIVICNGGSPMAYQSLVENKAVIGIPCNLDQYLMMSVLQKAGKGKMIRAGQVNQEAIRNAVHQSLAEIKSTETCAFEGSALAIDRITALIDQAVAH